MENKNEVAAITNNETSLKKEIEMSFRHLGVKCCELAKDELLLLANSLLSRLTDKIKSKLQP